MFLQDPLLDFKSDFKGEIEALSLHPCLLRERSLRLEAARISSVDSLGIWNRSWQVSVPKGSDLFPGKRSLRLSYTDKYGEVDFPKWVLVLANLINTSSKC